MARDKVKRFPTLDTPPAPPVQQMPRVAPRQLTTGVQAGQQMLGSNKVQINSSDGNIIISDGTNDRVLIGYQQDGF